MKTKLLKKVRKRYTILKICSYANTANPSWKSYCDSIGMPFYYVKDLDSTCGFRNRGYCLYEDAFSYLQRIIHADYYENKKRIIPAKIEKVWYK